MKKYLILLTAAILLVPALAYCDLLTFKVGYFIPRAQSDLWQIEFDNMSFNKSNYQNTMIGVNYEYFVTKELSLLIGLETYNKTKAGYYRDYVGYEFEEGDFAFPNDYEGDFDIAHAFNISITPIQFGVKLTPLGKRSRLIPYVGAGGGLYFWTLRLQGDIIDFNDIWYYEDPDYGDVEIYSIWPTDAREENKITFGYHVFGGLMFPVGNRVTLDIEFKYNNAKGTFSDAFEGFERFDLSGMQISLGLNYWF